MCGIVGMVDKSGKTPQEAAMRKMLQSIHHRGPDDEGLWSEGNVSLGHRRLSIIDISEAGHQPMFYQDLTIVFNGEIYNYLEVKEQLVALGHEFATHTDTEVILHAYKEWGTACLEKFIGMWAFVIMDKAKNTLFCARDRFGIKPFYYYNNDQKFIFASELKAVITASGKAEADLDSLLTYLVIGFTDHSTKTFYKDIFQLLPGQLALIDLKTGEFKIQQWYDLAKVKETTVQGEDYIERLKESMALHLRSDVPVGTCLSGGLDSSTVAALAAKLFRSEQVENTEETKVKFAAVTAQSESKHNDETAYAKQVVDYCDLDWHTAKPTYEDFKNHIEECLRIQDEPVGGASVFMQYWVMKKSREAGLKVMLDGQGGDETLLGYERYYPAYFWYLLTRGKWITLINEYLLAVRHSKLSFTKLTGYVAYFLIPSLRGRVLTKRVSFLKSQYVKEALNHLGSSAKSFLNIRELQAQELKYFQLPHLLRYEDRNSMAHSIEARVPFVEHNCIETALSLKPTDKINNGYTKFSLRKLTEAILPSEIAWRRNKIGFEAPTKLWLEQHLAIMQDRVDNSKILKDICNQIPDLRKLSLDMQWRLYNIAVWEEQYLG